MSDDIKPLTMHTDISIYSQLTSMLSLSQSLRIQTQLAQEFRAQSVCCISFQNRANYAVQGGTATSGLQPTGSVRMLQ